MVITIVVVLVFADSVRRAVVQRYRETAKRWNRKRLWPEGKHIKSHIRCAELIEWPSSIRSGRIVHRKVGKQRQQLWTRTQLMWRQPVKAILIIIIIAVENHLPFALHQNDGEMAVCILCGCARNEMRSQMCLCHYLSSLNEFNTISFKIKREHVQYYMQAIANEMP